MKNPIEDRKADDDGWRFSRVSRGGSQRDYEKHIRIAFVRKYSHPISHVKHIGFRIVRNKQ